MINANTVFLGIIALAAVVCTVFSVLMFQQVKRVTTTLESFLANLQKELEPLFTNLSQASQKIAQLSQNMDQKLNQAEELFEAIRHMGQMLDSVCYLMREGVSSAGTYTRSAVVGFKTAFEFFLKQLGKGGEKHGD